MSFASTIENAVDKYFSKNQKYFKSKKGENFELKNDLNSEYKTIRKDAVKRVIANMTLGKNVSELFADVLKCMQTDDLELKKLVYLYLMNYAKTQPELVILAVNTFIKDAEDINPLIRALAIRTMGCLRAEKIVDYLFEPLRKGLKDQDPYVRKTAAICVAKMYTLSPERTVEFGFVEQVESLLQDENPMVIANAIASLHEMRHFTNINSQSLAKLLNCLSECTEWGQIVIMESLCEYHAITEVDEAMVIAEKTSARLQHQNPSVVITAIRLIFCCLTITTTEFTDSILKKVKGPIISLLNSTQSELLFSFLRNMHVIVEKYPTLLTVHPFFCKYNDPLYVKLEKLSLLRKLANPESIDAVLSELKEYSSEVDIEFTSQAIYSLEYIALQHPVTAEKCVNCLLELLKTKIDYICTDAIVSLKNIIRRYPGQFDKSVEFIAPFLLHVNDKESVIWLIGEFPGYVVGIYDVLDSLISEFSMESMANQLNILVMTVKCFLKRPNDAKIQQFLQLILTQSTECANPDIRDRAFIYWRLLSVNPELTRQVVWHKKEPINPSLEKWDIDPQFLQMILKELSTLSALFHVDKKLFIKDSSQINSLPSVMDEGNLLDLEENVAETVPVEQDGVLDLLESFGPGNISQQILSPSTSTSPVQLQRNAVVTEAPQGGLLPLLKSENCVIEYKYHVKDDGVFLLLEIVNTTNTPLTNFAIQFNKNSFGIVPAALLNVKSVKTNIAIELPLTFHIESMYALTQPFASVQIAIKHDLGVYFGNSSVPLMVATFVPKINAEDIMKELMDNTQLQHVQFEVKCAIPLDKLQSKLPKTVVKNNVICFNLGAVLSFTDLH
eukprot:NODE_46_length_27655_cov_0.671796.p2 type:complete len:842 gc:universal NODE_46_length_27655_cov_0.671796:26049-23524(-)